MCMDDVVPEYSAWTWLSPAGQGTYGWLRISAGPGQEAWHVGRGGVTLCCRCSARVQGGHAVRRGGHAVEGSTARWAAARAVAEARSGHGVRADKNQLYELSSILRRASIGFSRVPTFPTLPALEGRARRRAPLVALAAV